MHLFICKTQKKIFFVFLQKFENEEYLRFLR